MNRLMIVFTLWIVLCQLALTYFAWSTWQMDKQFFDENYLNENDSQVEEEPEIEV